MLTKLTNFTSAISYVFMQILTLSKIQHKNALTACLSDIEFS